MPKTKSFASSLDEPAELVEKNSQILIEYSLKNKESKKKKNGAQFRARMREKRLKQARVLWIQSRLQVAPMNRLN